MLFRIFKTSVTLIRTNLVKDKRVYLSTASEFKNMEMSDLKNEIFQRLPKNIVPKHYRLLLKPDLERFTFNGNIEIDVEVKSVTDTVLFNALDMQISESNFILGNGQNIKSNEIKILEDERASIKFNQTLPIGEGVLKMNFIGNLNDKMKGFYRTFEKDSQGVIKHSAVTQFESTDARRCFPCWDEPSIKATFDISVIAKPRSEHSVVLSNMPCKQIKDVENGFKQYDFDRTPIMSTYLVAVVVGEYEYVEDVSEDGVLIRVYTPVGKKDQGRFALNVATKVLPYYKKYFNIAYPLPKMDLIAIADFGSGAMENWGLITYRETCLLVDEQNTSLLRKQFTALVVGHEIAHQWFGNLVTMEWWTHLWLNEGYASFIEFLCVDYLFPEYNIWKQFVTETYMRALDLDSLENSHPIEVIVNHPAEIDEIFDDISYNKGASVIRMLHNMLGEEKFRKGMHLYLTRFKYKNTFTEDLWQALGESSGMDVGKIMSTWTKQMGYPIVKVSRKKSAINPDDTVLELEQEKYSTSNNPIGKDQLWMIPIKVVNPKDNSIKSEVMFSDRKMEVVIKNTPESECLLLNPDMMAFYRTVYSDEMMKMLIKEVQNNTLSSLDRLGLITNTFSMIHAKKVKTPQFLELLNGYKSETDYNVWITIYDALLKLNSVLEYTDCYDKFQKFQRDFIDEIASKTSWEPIAQESHFETLLRTLILRYLVNLGDEKTIAKAKEMFEDHISEKKLIVADLRSVCYRAALRDCDLNGFERMLEYYKRCNSQEEKDRISGSFGAIKNVDILKKVLEFSISSDVRSQDTVFIINSVANLRAGRNLAWEFFKDHWELFKQRYECSFLLSRLVKCVTENFATADKAKDVEEYFKVNKSLSVERSISQSIENIHLNIDLIERDLDSIKSFLI